MMTLIIFSIVVTLLALQIPTLVSGQSSSEERLNRLADMLGVNLTEVVPEPQPTEPEAAETATTTVLPIHYDGLVNTTIAQPSNWFFETKGLEYPYVIALYPSEFMAEQYPPVSLNIAISMAAKGNASAANLSAFADVMESIAQTKSDVRVINLTRDSNLTVANGTQTIPAFEIHSYDFSRPFADFQSIDIGTVVNSEYMIGFEYTAPIPITLTAEDQFKKYLPEVKEMIESFEMIQVRDATTTETTMARE